MKERMKAARAAVLKQGPLIHCITNPISINDCANAVLALGARPIMAEHPAEVCGITATAGALAVNLGNITDARAESILKSGRTAFDHNIPSVIDLVGVACSPFRLALAREYIRTCRPAVIKGNISEVKAAAGVENGATGIDAGTADTVTRENAGARKQAVTQVKAFAEDAGAVVAASGPVDLVSDGRAVYLVENGTAQMARVTGTGCMLNVIIGTYLSVTDPQTAALLAAVTLGVCGEIADGSRGTGTYRTGLIDALSTLTDRQLEASMKVRQAR